MLSEIIPLYRIVTEVKQKRIIVESVHLLSHIIVIDRWYIRLLVISPNQIILKEI